MRLLALLALAAVLTAFGPAASDQFLPGTTLDQQKVSDTEGGFEGDLQNADAFGSSVAGIGDLDGDGTDEIVVGAVFGGGDLKAGPAAGDLWVLFPDSDGTVRSFVKIGDGIGGFEGTLSSGDFFGFAVAPLGDLDGDGTDDIAVGVPGLDGPEEHETDRFGGLWICFMNPDGTVRDEQLISVTDGGFTGELLSGDDFGSALAALDDVNGDGIVDLAVGARHTSDGGPKRGAVWILLLDTDGTVKGHQKISATFGGFDGLLEDIDHLGWAVASPGDFDGDGVPDVVASVAEADHGCPGLAGCTEDPRVGGFFLILLNDDGSVKEEFLVSAVHGGFQGQLANDDGLGVSLAALGDLDGDGVQDLAVGAVGDDDGGSNAGAVWILNMAADGTVKSHEKISNRAGNFGGELEANDFFGMSLGVADLDDDGRIELLVGTQRDDDGGFNRGALWTLWLEDGDPWENRGHALVGTPGYPKLSVDGTLEPGSPLSLDLLGALGSAPAFLVFGVDALDAPFYGGVLVPDPTPPGFVLSLATNASGQIPVSDTWPTGVPAGFTFYLQYWFDDPRGPFGFSASNAVRGTAP